MIAAYQTYEKYHKGLLWRQDILTPKCFKPLAWRSWHVAIWHSSSVEAFVFFQVRSQEFSPNLSHAETISSFRDFSVMKVVITGGFGFLGLHLCKRYSDAVSQGIVKCVGCVAPIVSDSQQSLIWLVVSSWTCHRYGHAFRFWGLRCATLNPHKCSNGSGAKDYWQLESLHRYQLPVLSMGCPDTPMNRSSIVSWCNLRGPISTHTLTEDLFWWHALISASFAGLKCCFWPLVYQVRYSRPMAVGYKAKTTPQRENDSRWSWG